MSAEARDFTLPHPAGPTADGPQAASGQPEERSIIESAGAQAEDLSLLQAVFAGYRPAQPRFQPGLPAAARVPAAPSARLLARQQGISLGEIRGSGPDGTVLASDVSAHLAGSSRQALPFPLEAHSTAELDCSALIRLCQELRPEAEVAGVQLSHLPFFFRALVVALREVPALHSGDITVGGEPAGRRAVHLGVAVSTDAGVIVPVVRDVGRKNLPTLARESADLAERARLDTLLPTDFQGASLTVSTVGTLSGIPGAVLSLSGIVRRPVALERHGQEVLAVRPMMSLTLSFGHHLVDQADAARFNTRVVELLEQPQRLLIRM